MSEPVLDQSDPVPNARPAIWDLVIQDMRERDATGRERYGTPLQAHNGRRALVDLYQELLDAVAYCRQEIEERADPAIRRTIKLESLLQGRVSSLRFRGARVEVSAPTDELLQIDLTEDRSEEVEP